MKNNNFLDKLTWDFIKLDENISPSVFSYLQSLTETLNKIRPSSTTDGRRIELAKSHLKEVKRHVNKLEEELEKEKANSKDLEFKLKKYKEQLKNLKKEE